MKKLLLICQALVLAVKAVDPAGPMMQSTELAPDGVYTLFWAYDQASETMTFEVHVKTLGYVGFGISPNGGMPGADVVIGWVKDGNVTFHDRHAEREAEPKIDESQDWELLEGRENDTHTILKFKRKLVTCDVDDMDITHDTQRVIWSYSNTDPPQTEGLQYHGSDRRGTRSILLTNKPPSYELPENAYPFDLLVKNVSVPATRTTYWAHLFELSAEARRDHVIMVEPIVQPGHEKLVHHAVVYGCDQSLPAGLAGTAFVHGYQELPDEHDEIITKCGVIYFAWAIGGGKTYYPEHVGLALSGMDYVRIEMHYDNPEQLDTYVDNSGLRLWLTPVPRPNELVMLNVGMPVMPYVIPPHYDRLTTQGYCIAEATQQAMENLPEGIKVVSVLLHAHLAGVGLVLRHFRDGIELPPIASDEHYDFDLQEYHYLAEEVVIMPGDVLRVDCDYKSGDDYILGGLGTNEEMCMAFVNYYPRMNMSACFSIPTGKQLMKMEDDAAVREKEDVKALFAKLDFTDADVRDKYQHVSTSGEMLAISVFSDQPYNVAVHLVPNITKKWSPQTDAICAEPMTTKRSGDYSNAASATPGGILSAILVAASVFTIM